MENNLLKNYMIDYWTIYWLSCLVPFVICYLVCINSEDLFELEMLISCIFIIHVVGIEVRRCRNIE